jgi:hypothetical protein
VQIFVVSFEVVDINWFVKLAFEYWKLIGENVIIVIFNSIWPRIFRTEAYENAAFSQYTVPISSTVGIRCSILIYDLRCHPLWYSRTIVSKPVHVSFSHMCRMFPPVYLYLIYSLAVCLSLKYTLNIYHHMLKMDCAVGRGRSFNCSIQIHF